MFFSGQHAQGKITKICESFGANLYPFPEAPAQRREMLEQVESRLTTLRTVCGRPALALVLVGWGGAGCVGRVTATTPTTVWAGRLGVRLSPALLPESGCCCVTHPGGNPAHLDHAPIAGGYLLSAPGLMRGAWSAREFVLTWGPASVCPACLARLKLTDRPDQGPAPAAVYHL